MKKNKGNTADIFSAVRHWATPHIIQPSHLRESS